MQLSIIIALSSLIFSRFSEKKKKKEKYIPSVFHFISFKKKKGDG
jgi:hypothetical protein